VAFPWSLGNGAPELLNYGDFYLMALTSSMSVNFSSWKSEVITCMEMEGHHAVN